MPRGQGFKAYRLHAAADGQRPDGRVVELGIDDLSAGEVVVRVDYCALNYKAALANAGMHRLIRSFPRIGGAEIIGVVESSSDARFAPGDVVQNTGPGVGVEHDGGFAQFARLRGDWLWRLDPAVDRFEAAAIGGNGLCAAMCIHRMEQNGLTPAAGPVLVTGATGGVATLAIEMLVQLGYRVVALTGKAQATDALRALGVAEVIDAGTLAMGTRALESARFAGAIDSVGGETLAWLTRSMLPGGSIASIGNAGGAALNTTVMPFILRGVCLIGIAGYPAGMREALWQRIWGQMRPRHLRDYTRVIGLGELPDHLERMLARQTHGRILVAPGA